MRIVILWSSLASYSVAFFKELALSEDCRLMLVHRKPASDVRYNRFDLSFCDEALEDSPQNRKVLEARVRGFSPDCILMSGWAFPHFMRIARRMRRKGVYVVAVMDNQWLETLKQYLGVLTARWFLKPSIDTFLVAGDRQAYFARKLGYDHLLYGCYTAEVDKFFTEVPLSERQRSFLFLGRLVQEKNIDGLAKAYELYRKRVDYPWTLVVAGAGPLEYLFRGATGVKLLGFVQPEALPAIMKAVRCLVMPSTFEPWGVAIHEAAAAGLPIIASYKCGATPALVRDGVNGFSVSPDAESISAAMVRIHTSSEDRLLEMSRTSKKLAAIWTPPRLADYFHTMVAERISLNRSIGSSVARPSFVSTSR